jgi:hypothetical protein
MYMYPEGSLYLAVLLNLFTSAFGILTSSSHVFSLVRNPARLIKLIGMLAAVTAFLMMRSTS